MSLPQVTFKNHFLYRIILIDDNKFIAEKEAIRHAGKFFKNYSIVRNSKSELSDWINFLASTNVVQTGV